jgi:dihydrodipicolinate reductase
MIKIIISGISGKMGSRIGVLASQDKNIEIAKLSTKYGIVERPNNRTYICGDNKWTSKEIFHDALKDESLMNEIFLKVKSAKESGVVAVNTENEEGDSCNEWDEIISEKVGE